MLNIKTTVINGTTYYSFTERGTRYTLSKCDINADHWEIITQRLSLVRSMTPKYLHISEMITKTYKSFLDTIAQLDSIDTQIQH